MEGDDIQGRTSHAAKMEEDGIQDRMIRAAKLDPALYEEVEARPEAITQSMMVVLMSSVAYGIGAYPYLGLNGLVFGPLVALVLWFLWAYVTFIVGTRLFPEPNTRSDVGELLRTIGFASSPGVLRIFGIVLGQSLAALLFFAVGVWMLLAMVVAVRQALDYESKNRIFRFAGDGTDRAVLVCLISAAVILVVHAVVISITSALFGSSEPPA
jgi:hypothetical protein